MIIPMKLLTLFIYTIIVVLTKKNSYLNLYTQINQVLRILIYSYETLNFHLFVAFKKDKIDNNRYGKVEFKAQYDSTLHGIGGYFDSHLYKDVDISKHTF